MGRGRGYRRTRSNKANLFVGRRIGFDIGRVLSNGNTADMFRDLPSPGKELHWGENYLYIPCVPGMFRGLSWVVEQAGSDNIWLISACSARVEEKVRAWLVAHDVFKRTGIKTRNVIFCRRPEEKEAIAVRLRLTDFVDDLSAVLKPMTGKVRYLYWFRADFEDRWDDAPEDVVRVGTWRGLVVAMSEKKAMEEERRRTRRRGIKIIRT